MIPDFEGALSDSSRIRANLVLEAIGDNQHYFDEVLKLCFDKPYPVSMRAARVIALYCEKDARFLYPRLNETVALVMQSEVEGVKRNFLKVLAENINLDAIEDPGLLVSFCFDKIMDAAEDPAVRVYAIDLVTRFSAAEPDLMTELRACLELIRPESPPSILTRTRRLLQKSMLP